MRLRPIVAVLLLLLVTACTSLPQGGKPAEGGEAQAQTAAAAEEAKAKEEAKAAQRKQQQKELRRKQQELAWLGLEQKIAQIDQRLRLQAVEQNQQRTARELAEAKRLLDLFLTEQRSREIEERKIALDRVTHRADHAKDEYAELQAMYEADEFAKSTKELVLKRGRREQELADRALEVARREFREFEQQTLPQRERELKLKVDLAELERRKADAEAEKVRIEQDLAERKHRVQVAELEEAIAELQTAIGRDGS